jgi:hypothetical protein
MDLQIMVSTLHPSPVMRPLLLLALTSAFTVSAVACSDTADTNTLAVRHAVKSNIPQPGAPAQNDDDTTGATDPDVGNPNATSKPSAPTTAGVPSSDFAITLGSTTPTVGLGESASIDVNVQPKNGFTGQVDITVSGLPEGATAAPVTAVAETPAKLVITTDVTAVTTPANGGSPLVITGTSGSIQATANATFKIAPTLTLTIPVNIDALRAAGTQYRDEWGPAFGQNQQALRTQDGNGIVVTVFNADSKAHIIHGANGFAHGNTAAPIQPNAFEMSGSAPRTRTLNPGVDANGYPHDGANGAGASFRIKVDAVN